MCLIALALDQHPRFPLVIAANRDEFLRRPAASLDWWHPAPGSAAVLGGRDLQAGGTWMAITATGRVAMLTNVRNVQQHDNAAPSRGTIVPEWLVTRRDTDGFWRDIKEQGHNPFNLLAGDVARGRWWWADDRAAAPQVLGTGLYGLSNAALDTPWPKVQRLKRGLADALAASTAAAELEARLFAALADRALPPDDSLPDTGIGLERERWLAPPFIRTPDSHYGTRCSTLLIAERQADGLHASLVERQFDGSGLAIAQSRSLLRPWPSQLCELSRVEH
jgi:uncharacterized protein with NRDE domain